MSRPILQLLPAAVILGLAFSVLAARTEPPHQRTPAVASADGAAPPTLAGTVLNASAALALPKRIAVVGDYLVVIDAASDSAIHVLDRHTGRLVRSLGRRGKGPGEFHGAWTLTGDPLSDGAVWVYDLPLRRLTRVPLAAEADSRASARRMLVLRDGAVLTGPEWISPDTILALGFLMNARVALFDSTGRRTGRIGQPPFSPEAGEPMQAAQALVAARQDHRRYAIASRYVSRVELLDLARGTIESVAGPVAVNTGPAVVDLDRFAYVDVAATATRVVALFSGRNLEEYQGAAGFGSVLHVFDWEGRFLGAYRLDTDVLAIAADEGDGTVYALRLDPEPAVVRYRLPPVGPVATAATAPAIGLSER